jgi:hypothetical protein
MNTSVDLSAASVSELPNLVVAGRSCGACSLCCKVFAVPDFKKPRSVSCVHCVPGKGCGIHHDRPRICRDFFCNWLLLDSLGPEWKPDACHLVLQSIVYPGGHQGLEIHVDPDYPDSWRQQPFYDRIRSWAKKASQQITGPIYFVLLQVGTHKRLILADREVDLGEFADGDTVCLERRLTSAGAEFVAAKNPNLSTATLQLTF